MHHSEFYWKNSVGTKIFAQHWQADSAASPKAVVLLLHGLGEHSSRYEHVAAFFNHYNIAVLANDRSGHGKSGEKRGHIAKYALVFEDIKQLIKRARSLYPDAPLVLYGHSMGGGIVLDYLLNYFEGDFKAAIATSPLLQPAFKPNPALVFVGKMLRSIYPGFVQSNQLDSKDISRDSVVVKGYNEDPMIHGKVSSEMGLGMLESGVASLNSTKEVPVPLYICHGTADKMTDHKSSVQFAKQKGALVTLKIWENYYHELHNEPEKLEVLAHLYEWLEKQL